MSIPSFSSRPIPSMFMHCQGLVNLWPWTANCLITWFFSVCSWEERISHCLQLSLVSKLLSTYIAGHCPPSLCCVKVWWLSDYEQQRVQNIKRQQDLETSLKSSLNWIAVTLELHSFRCSDEEYIDIFICSPQKPLKSGFSAIAMYKTRIFTTGSKPLSPSMVFFGRLVPLPRPCDFSDCVNCISLILHQVSETTAGLARRW